MKRRNSAAFNLFTFLIIGIVLVFANLLIKESGFRVAMAQETDWGYGYRISRPYPLDGFENVIESKIEWVASIPDEDNTRIIIQTAVTDSDTEEPTSWLSATNGGPIPGIEEGDLSGFLWTMQILENDDPDAFSSPQLHSLTETITMKAEGYRTSPEFLLCGEENDIVKDARIFWQADERFGGDINVKVNVLSGGSWVYEQDVVNGGQIPGLEPGTSLAGAKIQTKASFIGGPEFYPSLEDIKIFLELE